MKKPLLFKHTKETIIKKLSNPLYVSIINSHDKKLIKNNFMLLELILITKALNKINSMSEAELKALREDK